MKKIVVLAFILVLLQSCTAVKAYKMQKLNDPEMKLSARTNEKYESTFQVYREGAAGANGGKSGGGCGCN